jgi:dTDP-4-amino-4,6-dideoxygalactose transaminase
VEIPVIAPWPQYEADELAAASNVLRSGKVNYWTGQEAREFEKEYAAWCGNRRAIALANGTVALELALMGLGLCPGDEVVTTPRTFLATSSACVVRGLVPVFADVDPDSGNITAESIEAVLTEKTRAIIPVHLGGWPCDMDAIMSLAEKHHLKVIEDCAQAHGAQCRGRSVGSIGHVGAWSFCQDKIISTGGEGGMVTTDDETVWSAMWSYKDHGKSYEAVYQREHPKGFRWLHEDFGTNWRLTEMQSAIGRIQLAKLPGWVALRQRNAAILKNRLVGFPCLRIPEPGPDFVHSYYRFYCYVRRDRLKGDWTRGRIREECAALGAPCTGGACSEIYMEKAFEKAGLRPERRLPVARELGETTLMYLVHPTLSTETMEQYAEIIASVLARAQA